MEDDRTGYAGALEELQAILAGDPSQLESRISSIEKAIDAGQLERTTERIRFTRSGVLLADGFLADLL